MHKSTVRQNFHLHTSESMSNCRCYAVFDNVSLQTIHQHKALPKYVHFKQYFFLSCTVYISTTTSVLTQYDVFNTLTLQLQLTNSYWTHLTDNYRTVWLQWTAALKFQLPSSGDRVALWPVLVNVSWRRMSGSHVEQMLLQENTSNMVSILRSYFSGTVISLFHSSNTMHCICLWGLL